jgi:hypothetical protein
VFYLILTVPDDPSGVLCRRARLVKDQVTTWVQPQLSFNLQRIRSDGATPIGDAARHPTRAIK